MSEESLPETLESLEQKNQQLTLRLGELSFNIAYSKAESLQVSQELLKVRQGILKLQEVKKPEIVPEVPVEAIPVPDLDPSV